MKTIASFEPPCSAKLPTKRREAKRSAKDRLVLNWILRIPIMPMRGGQNWIRFVWNLILMPLVLWFFYQLFDSIAPAKERLLDYLAGYRIIGNDKWSLVPFQFTVSQELLWLRNENSSETQRKGNVRRWKSESEDWWRDSRPRRLSACCSVRPLTG
jgi:hypothetical protein